MLELSELNRFRHPQMDSETLKQIWIFDLDPTGFDSDPSRPGRRDGRPGGRLAASRQPGRLSSRPPSCPSGQPPARMGVVQLKFD